MDLNGQCEADLCFACVMQVKQGSEHCLGFENGVHHLRKALHMFPNSVLIR